ncbi:unnamed protein product [Calypogeia fissa]
MWSSIKSRLRVCLFLINCSCLSPLTQGGSSMPKIRGHFFLKQKQPRRSSTPDHDSSITTGRSRIISCRAILLESRAGTEDLQVLILEIRFERVANISVHKYAVRHNLVVDWYVLASVRVDAS